MRLKPFSAFCLLSGHGRPQRPRAWVVELENPFGQTYYRCRICRRTSRSLPNGRGPESIGFFDVSQLERARSYVEDRWWASALGQARLRTAYRQTVANLPFPTDEQIDDFIGFVASAHSWYKHLPFFLPGHPFTFFLNPHSGMDMELTPKGEPAYRERTDDSHGFRHYTWMTTAEYRERFGFLDYSTNAGTTLVSGRPVFAPTATRLPRALQRAGTVNLTGVIHPLAPRPVVLMSWAAFSEASWPVETGGEEALDQIRRIADAVRAGEELRLELPDGILPELERICAPERARQMSCMKTAIDAMLAISSGSKVPAPFRARPS